MSLPNGKTCRAGLDCHAAINRHYYAVPHPLVSKKLWARITARTVEVFHAGQRIASHVRTSGNGQPSPQRDHMPAHHRFREDWTPQRIHARAAHARAAHARAAHARAAHARVAHARAARRIFAQRRDA